MSIDYGNGKTNIDPETGIRFGVISQNEILQAWADSSEPVYTYLCPHCSSYLGENPDLDGTCENCKQEYSSSDFEGQEPDCFVLDDGEYKAQSDSYGDIFITKSPYYTLCDFCSPCAPGAGYLTTPGIIKAYCFHHDFWDNTIARYAVFSVETGNVIQHNAKKGKDGKYVNP